MHPVDLIEFIYGYHRSKSGQKAVKNKVNFAPGVWHDTAHFFGRLFSKKNMQLREQSTYRL
jgi:hypothetical protein